MLAGSKVEEESAPTAIANVDDDDDDRLDKPSSSSATRIMVQMSVLSLGGIDPQASTFSIDFFLRERWIDPRLSFDDSDNAGRHELYVEANQIWTPDTFLYRSKCDTLMERVKLYSTGRVVRKRHLSCTTLIDFDVRSFPFDVHNLTVTMLPFASHLDEIVLDFDEPAVSSYSTTDLQLESRDWSLNGFTLARGGMNYRRLERHFSVASVSFEVQRASFSYILRYFAPLFLITLLSTFTPWLSGTVRTILSSSAVLLVGGFNVMLPSAPGGNHAYTALDIFVAVCFVFTVVLLTEHALVSSISKVWRDVASATDTYFRRTVWIVYANCVVAFFAHNLNAARVCTSALMIAAVWALLQLVMIIYLFRSGHFSPLERPAVPDLPKATSALHREHLIAAAEYAARKAVAENMAAAAARQHFARAGNGGSSVVPKASSMPSLTRRKASDESSCESLSSYEEKRSSGTWRKWSSGSGFVGSSSLTRSAAPFTFSRSAPASPERRSLSDRARAQRARKSNKAPLHLHHVELPASVANAPQKNDRKASV